MSTNTHRITGPKETFSPRNFIQKSEESPVKADFKLIDNGRRHNGREFSKARPLYMKAGLLSQADGSAYVEVDQTKVMVAVYGPREVSKKDDFSLIGQLMCEFKYSTFAGQERRSAVPENDEKDMSGLILEAVQPAVCLHKFPKALFNIYVTVLQNDGGVLSACINCVSLALANAGVEMYDLITATSARLYKEHILLDPSSEEEAYISTDVENDGKITLAMMSSLNQVTTLSSVGNMDVNSLSQATKLCKEVCQQLYNVQKQSLTVNMKDNSAK